MEVIIIFVIICFIGSAIFKDGDAKYKKRWPYTVEAAQLCEKVGGADMAKKLRNDMKKGLKDKEMARKLDAGEEDWFDYLYSSSEELELKRLNRKLSDLERKLR